MNRRRGFLLALAALVLTAALCLALETYDNKYTHPASQPISGMLMLSNADLKEQPLRYLAREWRFYPGQLLEPADARDNYHHYLNIGEISSLPGNCGSYALTLMLPTEPREYALELPEVYTSCRLYIDGRLKLEMGDPEAGLSALGSRLVPFTAAGQTELLLSVRDCGAVYGGMVHPPAFGLAGSVAALREFRLFLHIFAILAALLLIALAISFGWKSSRRRGLLSALGALCFLVAVGRPVLYGLYTVGYQPWAALEVGSRYGMLLVALLLQCDLYGCWRRKTLLLSLPCCLGLLLAVANTLLSAGLPEEAGPVFSGILTALKLYNAALLIGLPLWALWKGYRYSAPLLCATVSLAVCIGFDRGFPLYEPILGGWYPEIGEALLTLTFAAVLWKEALDAYRFRLAYGETQALLARELAQQKEHYRQLSQQIALSRQASHDLRHNLRVLRSLAEQQHTEQMLSYLDDYGTHLAKQSITTYSDHLVADAVLCRYAAEAQRIGAVYDARFPVPPELNFPDDELCILLGNLLENGIDAMEAQTEGPRTLYLRGDAQGERLGLIVENSFNGVLQEREGVFLSTKHDGPGLGLASVRSIVGKYGGLADFTAENGSFRVELMIPLAKKPTPDAPHSPQ